MITLENVNLQQGEFELHDINFRVDTKEYITMMGPTGCGKTTLLEAICGLRRIESGQILIGGRDVSQFDPARREIGYVPQDLALFPSMRIDKQIQFGLVARKASTNERNHRTSELAELLGLQNLLMRYPNGLSGGEKQRVALARALSFRPRLLCLDEPLSALDEVTRSRIAGSLKAIYEYEDVAILHITHNAKEAESLGTSHFRFAHGQVISC